MLQIYISNCSHLRLVGYSSGVYKKMTPKDTLMANLPTRESATTVWETPTASPVTLSM